MAVQRSAETRFKLRHYLTLGQFDLCELPQPLDLLLDRRSQFGKYPAYLFRVFHLTRTLGEVSDSVF